MRRSPGNTQARNPCESGTGRLFNLTFTNQLRHRLGHPTWTDMMRGARCQLNDQPPHARKPAAAGAQRAFVTRSEGFLGRQPDLSSRWPGSPGQPAWIFDEEGKASAGRPRCRPGYFVSPAESVGGWLAREYGGGQRLVATSNIGLIDDPRVIFDALALSDGMLALAGPLRGHVASVHEATRALFGKLEGPTGPHLVILEPLIDAPVQLVPALDEAGDPMYIRREQWPDNAGGEGERRGGGKEKGQGSRNGKGLKQGPAPPPAEDSGEGKRGSVQWLRNLPPDTRIFVNRMHIKTGKSGDRWGRYRDATTLAELKELNPTHYLSDLKFDFARRLVTLESDEPLPVDYSWACPVLMAHRMSAAGEAGHAAQREAESSWGSPTLGRIHELEDLEGRATGPLHSGEPAAEAELIASLLEPGPLAPHGDGLGGYTITYSDSADVGDFRDGAPVMFFAAAGGTGAPIQGLAAARASGVWDGEGGWSQAVRSEVERVLVKTFPGRATPTIVYVPASHRAAALARFGAMAVETKNMVVVLKEKVDPDGALTKRACRFTLADIAEGPRRLEHTFASCVYSSSVRRILQDSTEGDFDLEVLDVPGAYYHGSPPRPGEAGGRVLYCIIPRALASFGYPQVNAHGEQMLFLVDGNLPGRRDAGQIWGAEYAKFLRSVGFRQSVVDRRIFGLIGKDGRTKLTTGVHVDDTISSVRDRRAGSEFNAQWCKRFGGQAARVQVNEQGETVKYFLGLRIRKSPGLVKLDSPRLFQDLETALVAAFRIPGAPERRHVWCEAPLPGDALGRLRALPGEKEGEETVALASLPSHEAARSLLGLAGYCINMFRPDGAHAYAALSQQVSRNLTGFVWRSTLQLCAYLVKTSDLALTFRRTGRSAVGYADSSSMNGGAGQSWGGFAIGQPGSGLNSYRCLSSRMMSDSSGGNELIVATLLLKELIGERVISAELGLLPRGEASNLFMDASAVLSGVAMDRVSRESRYLATRLAMLRQASADGVIALRKIGTSDNAADIFTKPVVGEAFRRLRALVLGLEVPPAVSSAGGGAGK